MTKRGQYLFTSESVSEGHPDKVADRTSDEVVDAFLAADPYASWRPPERNCNSLQRRERPPKPCGPPLSPPARWGCRHEVHCRGKGQGR